MNRAGRLARLAFVVASALWMLASPSTYAAPVITVSEDDRLQRVIREAPVGSTLVLEEGTHRGPIHVRAPLTITGTKGAEIVAPPGADAALTVDASGVTVSGIGVRGGWTGIDLHRAARAVVSDVVVEAAEAEGIRVYARPAHLESVDVRHLRGRDAQGIEILSAPDTVVRDSTVAGAKTGIVAHLSEVVLERNRVTESTAAGIMIREMSQGVARANTVTNAAGAGLYCGDQSRCAFEGNRVTEIEAAGDARSSAGWGLVVHFHSSASSHGDVLEGRAGRIALFSGSRFSHHSPLELGSGWGAAGPGALAVAAAALLVALAYGVMRPFVARGRTRVPRRVRSPRSVLTTLLVAALAIQTLHMGEHVVQVFRVHWDGVPSRGAIVGSLVDTEWVHFAYNTAIFVAMGAVLWLRGVQRRPRFWDSGDRLVAAALLIQSYHVVEHSVKLFQHITTGAKVNPGILGHNVDLVWLHFSVNLAVYVAFAAGCAAYLWHARAVSGRFLGHGLFGLREVHRTDAVASP